MNETRRQLTLFVEAPKSEAIEAVRRTYNPRQYELIAAHVTLCREDEIEDLDAVMQNINALDQTALTIGFGETLRFADGAGVLLPATHGREAFWNLRKCLLQGIIDEPRQHEPHLTLMHPRNATCTDDLFEQIKSHDLPREITFLKMSLIEQEIGKKWYILDEIMLEKKQR